jgi:hypothetical protein
MTKPTIGVIAVCWTYDDYIPAWAESIKNLTTQPDKVILVCKTAPEQLPIDVTVIVCDEPFTFGGWLNLAVAACDTDWIVWVGMDDTYRPCALDGIADSEADVMAYGMALSTGGTRMPAATNAAVLQVAGNEVPCGSPFRRRLWERVPFQPQLGPYEDWALWVGFAHIGAVFENTGRIDFDYRWHDDTPTALEPLRSRIIEWVRGLA